MATTTIRVFNMYQPGFVPCGGGGEMNGTFTGQDLNGDNVIDFADGEIFEFDAMFVAVGGTFMVNFKLKNVDSFSYNLDGFIGNGFLNFDSLSVLSGSSLFELETGNVLFEGLGCGLSSVPVLPCGQITFLPLPFIQCTTFQPIFVTPADGIVEPADCKMCYDAGYEQGQMDCEPDTTGAVTSDPHVSGFQKQSFDFTGEVGKYYALISDENFAVNAKFDEAFTTGMYVDPKTMITSAMRPQGTWLTEILVILGETTVQLSITKSPLDYLCPEGDRLNTCFYGGSIKVNDEDVIRIGSITSNDVEVKVLNQGSFGRVAIQAAKQWRFVGNIDYVPAPEAWGLSETGEAPEFAHLNFNIKKIALSSAAHGVIGQTSRVKYDENGQAIMSAQDKDGMGVIDGVAADYELDSIASTDFKYSVFSGSDAALDGFSESKLNAEANKIFNV